MLRPPAFGGKSNRKQMAQEDEKHSDRTVVNKQSRSAVLTFQIRTGECLGGLAGEKLWNILKMQ